ncbi:hypothetical protein CTZ28_28500 [Streptomyces shenzhenensis]|uniref:Uncharacterized protein n=1 Tax=Streptomyces shenzhenensis TaxID=943815 RepID=A0A3M0HZK8_9ACTN|nr:hypothetical protein CTZ28_28500 [Streptomyces shenzhenensis]
MMTRSTAVTAGIVAAAALTATGITYASAASEPGQVAPVAPVALPAAPAPAPAQAPFGAIAQAPFGTTAQAPFGGNVGKGNNEENEEENEGREGKGKRFEEGRIHINERTYSSHPDGCITVISGLGAKTLNIRNESRRTVEVFRGAVCDNGAPIATVGPHSSNNGVKPHETEGVHVKEGVLGSFRVIRHHEFKY